MSDATRRVTLAEARAIAEDLTRLLEPFCRSIAVAGSIRRRQATVGDIDLVVEPLLTPTRDLFGGAGAPTDELSGFLDDCVELSLIDKRLDQHGRPCWGPSLKRAIHLGLPVDIQSVTDPDTLGMWIAIRTGPADFSRRLVTPRRRGGLLPPGADIKNGFQIWRWGKRVPTPTEDSVFEALGLPHSAPWERGDDNAE